MKPSSFQNILIYLLLIIISQSKQNQSSIISKIKTDKNFIQNTLNPKNIYTIDIERISTNRQDQTNKCHVQQKQIISYNDFEKFRIRSQIGRQESVYQTLTILQDKDNGIQNFKILGDYIIIILVNGTIHFLNNTKVLQIKPLSINLNFSLYNGQQKYVPFIAPINGNAYIATPKNLAFCESKIKKCTKIEGYKQVQNLYNFFAFELKNKQFLFFMTGSSLTTYQISQNGVAINIKIYDEQFFNKQKIFVQDIILIPGNKFLLLDFYSGIFELEYSQNMLTNIKSKPKIIYQQYGCRHLTSQHQGQYLALQCSLTQKTFFILQLIRQQQTNQFIAHQPIFFNQVLTGINSNSEIIMANIFSGVRLFWASMELQSPYPYDFQKAGSIFLHNAKGSQISVLNGRKVIYIFTEDELRIYDLTVSNAQVVCYSAVPIKQQYKLTYTYPCEKQLARNLKVCTLQKKLNYEAWEHKQVGFRANLLPLLVSFTLVLGIGALLLKLYKKYDRQIEEARLKYSSNQQFVIEG